MIRFASMIVVGLLLLAACAVPAEAHNGHGGVAFRNTPLNPFRGPVPTRNLRQADFFVAGHHAFAAPFAIHGVPFRSSYSLPFYAPPATVVYSQPSPVIYAQPAPAVNYQSYSASGYGPAAYSAPPQAYSAGVTYQLPDGRLVLPSGQVIEPR